MEARDKKATSSSTTGADRINAQVLCNEYGDCSRLAHRSAVRSKLMLLTRSDLNNSWRSRQPSLRSPSRAGCCTYVRRPIPSSTDADMVHQRLSKRLSDFGLVERKMAGDGNCQLKAQKDFYEAYVTMKYEAYVQTMSRSGEWGDHVTLQAAADYFGVKIGLVTSFKDTSFVEITPRDKRADADMSSRIISQLLVRCPLQFIVPSF